MKVCCEPASGPSPRALFTGLLYAVLAATLGFVLWQQWQS